MRKFEAVLMLGLAFGTVPLFAAHYTIDPAHSSVSFRIKHFVGRVTGVFRDFSGTIEFDESKMTASKINGEVNVASIDTGNAKRDEHLRSPDFFDTAKFPRAMLVSKSVDPKAKTITADLTLHGVTKEVQLQYEYFGTAPGKDGKTRLGGAATTKIDRRDFGINFDPTGLSLGNEVELIFEIEAMAV